MSERGQWKFAFGFVVALGSGPVWAQDYSAGKTPAQLFASDCSACHKSPQGLAKGQDTRSLANFLREHYTTKLETASALATFVANAGSGGQKPARTGRENAKPDSAAPPKPRNATAAPEGDQAAKPAPKSRAAASPASGAKSGESEGANPASRSAARPSEKPRPPSDIPKPADTRAPSGMPRSEKPADRRAATSTSKLKSYTGSGDGAKAAAGSGDGAKTTESLAADRAKRLQFYANSGAPADVRALDATKAGAGSRSETAPVNPVSPEDAAKRATKRKSAAGEPDKQKDATPSLDASTETAPPEASVPGPAAPPASAPILATPPDNNQASDETGN